MKVVQISTNGGPEVLRYMEIEKPAPGPDEVLIKVAAAGVNFIDTYHRTGLYPVNLPYIPGLEGAGTVEEAGPDLAGSIGPGDPVAWASVPGSYAEYVVAPASAVLPVPVGLDLRQAAAAMLQGMTAHYLAFSTYPVQSHDTVLVHAGAGGVGLLLTQILKRIGATVITTVGTPDKARLSRDAGADHAIIYTEADFTAECRKITGGRGVDVVYDSVGRSTFSGSLDCLRSRGMLVLFGQSSGKPDPVDPALLAKKGSLYLTRPSLFDYTRERSDLEKRASDVLAWVQSGQLRLRTENVLPLRDAAEAHSMLEERRSTGKILLVP